MDIVQKYNSFRVIKSIEMSGHVACTGEMINAHKILLGKLEGKRSRIRPKVKRCGLGSSDSEQGAVTGCCEHDNDLPGST